MSIALLGTKTLCTNRLILRPLLESDAAEVYANWTSDVKLSRFLSWAPHTSVVVTRDYIMTKDYSDASLFDWGIVFGNELVGEISAAASVKHESAELGYCIGSRWWNRGIATEAVGGAAKFLLDEVGLHKLRIRRDVDNPASGRVAEKNGFRHEGTMRGELKRRDGSFADLELYGLIAGEQNGSGANKAR